MLKAHLSIFHLHHRLCRRSDGAFFCKDLINAFHRRARNEDHHKNHREHHHTHEDLDGVGEKRCQRTSREPNCGVVAAGDDGFCAKPADEHHAYIHADLHDRTIQRDDAFSKRVQSANDRAHKIEFLDLECFLIKRFDNANTAHVFLHNIVEIVVVREDFAKDRIGEKDDDPERHSQDRQRPEKDRRDLAVDAERHDHRKDHHHRRTHRHADHHIVGIAHVGDVRRQARHDRRSRKLVNVREGKCLHPCEHILAQVRRKSRRRVGAAIRRAHARRTLQRCKKQQQPAKDRHLAHIARFDAAVDEIAHPERDNDFKDCFDRSEKDRLKRRRFIFPDTAEDCSDHGSSLHVWSKNKRPLQRSRQRLRVHTTAII